MPGTIDDARIYNRALSAAEVAQIAASPGPEGDLMYNNDYHVFQFCDGRNWIAMGPVPGAGPPPGTVTRTALGGWGKDHATSCTVTNITLAAGDTLLVATDDDHADSPGSCTSSTGVCTVTWNGISLNYDAAGVMSGAGAQTSIWSLYTATGGTGNLVVTSGLTGGSMLAIVATKVSGLAPSSLDQKHAAGGNSTTPSSGATPATAQADEFLWGVVGWANNNSVTGSWSNSFTAGGNARASLASAQCSGSSSGWVGETTEEGYNTVSATGAYTAAKTAAAGDNWSTAIATYKIAIGCSNPNGSEGDMIYNSDHHVYQYCDGTYWHGIGPIH